MKTKRASIQAIVNSAVPVLVGQVVKVLAEVTVHLVVQALAWAGVKQLAQTVAMQAVAIDGK